MRVKMLDNKIWSINFESVSLKKGESYDLSDSIANRICSLGFAKIDNGGTEKIQQEPEESDIDTKLENAEEIKPTKEVSPNGDSNKDALALKIDDLELSSRSLKCLKHAGIETVEELMNKEFEELLKIKKFGKKSVEEINEKLSEYNLVLAPNELHTNS